jgi:acyl-CoA thioester hydrolase
MDAIYQVELKVPDTAVDGNGHVNNVAYVQWMQDAAIGHSEATGCTRMTRACGAIWVVRTHHVEYLRPAFGGDVLTVQTWVADWRRVRSLRRYKFIRAADGIVLAQGETDWVFVDALTGRPRAIPPEIGQVFQLAPDLK